MMSPKLLVNTNSLKLCLVSFISIYLFQTLNCCVEMNGLILLNLPVSIIIYDDKNFRKYHVWSLALLSGNTNEN